ncbi:hypothetical protein R6Q57_022985, partial [Mikania cordata]
IYHFGGCMILILGADSLTIAVIPDALTIAVIPGDVGKPTTRLEKTKVKDGWCYWDKPHSETVKFIRDQKTGKINEKIYHFVVDTWAAISKKEKGAGGSKRDVGQIVNTGLDHGCMVRTPFHVVLIAARDLIPCENLNLRTLNWLMKPQQQQRRQQLKKNNIKDHHYNGTDDSSVISARETLLRDPSEEVIKNLKGELALLARQAAVLEMELQTLRRQVVKEGKRGLDLSKEVAALKKERNELNEECEKMKAKVKVNSNLLTEGRDLWAIVDELKQELNYEKDLNSNLRLQLQKTQESNA